MKQQRHILMMISSIVMMLLMGTVYSYSVFRLPIEEKFHIGTLLSGLPYMTSLFFYACSMMISGRFLKPTSLRSMVVMGTLLIASGWLLSGLSTRYWKLILTYGVLLGTGVGKIGRAHV